MKKRIIALGATIFSATLCALGTQSVDAVTTEIVTNDEFVFNANDLESGYGAGKTVSTINNVSLSMSSKFDGMNCTANGFSFGDYQFDKVLLATPYSFSFLGMNFQSSFDGNTPAYYVSAPKNTKIGIYYTLVGTAKNENTYYVSNDSTLEVVKEVKSKKKTTYETVEIFTEESDTMYYSEFTFDNMTKVGIRSTDQYIGLFGLTIVTEEEISYRNEADLAIEALVNEYNLNGVSTSETFTALVNNAKAAVENVNHISQIDDYKSFVEITNLYDELVSVESSINTLVGAPTRGLNLLIKFDEASRLLLNKVTNSILNANNKGISNNMISNYYIYEAALAKYNELEEDYNQAQTVVELIDSLGEATLTAEFKAQLDSIEAEYQLVNDTTNVTNYDKYLGALDAYNNLVLEDNQKAQAVVEMIEALGDVEYTNEYQNQLAEISNAYANVVNKELVTNYADYEAKLAAYNELSNNAVTEFLNKVQAANELSGTKESYVAIQEAKAAYDALVAADKANEEVVNAYSQLQNVEVAYVEYEEEVTENSFACSYNEDGTVKYVFFMGTIENFTSVSELSSLTIYVKNENNDEDFTFNVTKVNTALKISGEYVKAPVDGVRYIYSRIANTDNMYAGTTFSMYYVVEYVDGSVLTSSVNSIEVK